jgi:cytoskeletal protein RodZ
MDNNADIIEILNEFMEAKGMDVERLSQATDIPSRFINSLIEGKFDQLPAKPYVRGYLFKIADALDLESGFLWQAYRNTVEVTASGAKDTLPTNRFAIRPISSGRLAIIFLLVVILSFVGFRFNEILGKPTLEVDVPELTSSKSLEVSGVIESTNDTLTLNGEIIYPDQSGNFSKDVQLEPGLNTLEFQIKRRLGRETKIVKQVFYQPESLE